MKVSVWKQVDIECEVDVRVEDLLNEFSERMDEQEANEYAIGVASLCGILDHLTKILARVPDEMIVGMTAKARLEIHTRLQREAYRY